MLICGNCKQEKEDIEFNWRVKGKKRHTTCKECHSKYLKKYYIKNRQKHIDKAKKWAKAYRNELRKFVLEYLKNHPCINCNESDIVVLDFHHRKRIEKDNSISAMLSQSVNIDRLIKEINKCDILCANCHRRLHSINTWKNTFEES